MTKLNYPILQNIESAVKDTALKYAFAYAAQEALRLRYNEEGEKFRHRQITLAEWVDFQINWYEPKSNTVINDIGELRQMCKDYAQYFSSDIDLESISGS